MSSVSENECKFCKKSFRREKTLASHMCSKKRRYMDRKRPPNKMGHYVYQLFFKKTTNAKKDKDIYDFINSQYYSDFVRFGRHICELNPISPERFINYVIDNGIKLKDWTKDYVYDSYLKELIIKEPAERALERTIKEMDKWAEENNDVFNNFFINANVNEATFMLRNGRVSPWVLYLSETGDQLLNKMNIEHEKIIAESIDPDDWKKIFEKRPDEVDFVMGILKEAEL